MKCDSKSLRKHSPIVNRFLLQSSKNLKTKQIRALPIAMHPTILLTISSIVVRHACILIALDQLPYKNPS